MDRTIVRSICLVCHQSFEHESQENTLGFHHTWNRMWNILVQHFHLEPKEWEEILHFYDQVLELPLCPSKCRKELNNLLTLQDKLESISQEMDIIKGNLTSTILNISSSSTPVLPNKEIIKIETEIISSQEEEDLQENRNYSKIICDKSIDEKIHGLRSHIINRLNPNVLMDGSHDSKKKSSMENNNSDNNNTNNFLCENSNNNSSMATEPAATTKKTQFNNNEFPVINSDCSSSSSNIDNKTSKVVLNEENEAITNINVNSDNITVRENDCLHNDYQTNRFEMMEVDPSIMMNDEEEPHVGKLKEEQLKEGIFSYEQWSYVQLEGDDMFTCLSCQTREESQEEMIQHIQCLHEQTQSEVSILGIPDNCEQIPQYNQHTKKKRTTKINRQTLRIPKGKLNVKSRWSCNYPGCGKVYRAHDRLITHKKVHIDIFYKCPLCRTTSRMKIEVEDHLQLSHPENPSLIPLKISKSVFDPTSITSTSTSDQPLENTNLKTRKIRKKKTTEDPSHFCKICNKGFCTPHGLVRHNESIHEGVIFKCPVCGLQKIHIQSIKLHLKTIHPHVDISTISIRKEQGSKNSNHYDHDNDSDIQDLSFDNNDRLNHIKETEDNDDIVILD